MKTTATISPERFRQGISIEDFRAQMKKNQELFKSNYESFKLDAKDAEFFSGVCPKLNVLVLAEDWCGDVLRYMPALARVADIAPGWNVKVFPRDENLDLADCWLKEGKYRAIPVVAFFNSEMEEIACFTEKPQPVYDAEEQAKREFARSHSHLADAHLPYDRMSEETKPFYSAYIKAFREENKPAWQQLFIDEIREKLQVAASRQTAA